MYKTLVENSKVTNYESVVYSTSPFEYAIKYYIGSSVMLYNSDNCTLTFEEAKLLYNSGETFINQEASTFNTEEHGSLYDAFFYGSDLSEYTITNNVCISGANSFVPFTMSELHTGTNTGNCGPTAALNLVALYDHNEYSDMLMGGSAASYDTAIILTYEILMDYLGFDDTGIAGTDYAPLQDGIKAYINGSTPNAASITCDILGSWSNYKACFDAGKCNIISIFGYIQNSDGSWRTGGHALIGVGYLMLSDGTRYIRVYDGWRNSNTRYLCYQSDGIISYMGATVTISP